ncbi:MAG: hypothetical protein D6806_01450 [Deltaproteobacteria bacterium]|nr:MAG: hypothetical protein D6806_01450 [Deltaproteobacteria bacterium]
MNLPVPFILPATGPAGTGRTRKQPAARYSAVAYTFETARFEKTFKVFLFAAFGTRPQPVPRWLIPSGSALNLLGTACLIRVKEPWIKPCRSENAAYQR